jgi:hypothetical protein
MHRVLVVVGVLALASFSGVALLSYSHTRSDCATDVFSGNATDPGGCSASEEALGLSVLASAASVAMTVAGLLSGRKAKASRRPLAPAQAERPPDEPPPREADTERPDSQA